MAIRQLGWLLLIVVVVASTGNLSGSESFRLILERSLGVNGSTDRLVLRVDPVLVEEPQYDRPWEEFSWFRQYQINKICDGLPTTLVEGVGGSRTSISDIYSEIMRLGESTQDLALSRRKLLEAKAARLVQNVNLVEAGGGISVGRKSVGYEKYGEYRNRWQFLSELTPSGFDSLRRISPEWKNDNNLEEARRRVLAEWKSFGNKEDIDESVDSIRALFKESPVLLWREKREQMESHSLTSPSYTSLVRTETFPHNQNWFSESGWTLCRVASENGTGTCRLEIKVVKIGRPWMDRDILFKGDWKWRINSGMEGAISSGIEGDWDKSLLLPEALVLARNAAYQNWEELSKIHALNSLSPNSVFLLGRVCSIVPECPKN